MVIKIEIFKMRLEYDKSLVAERAVDENAKCKTCSMPLNGSYWMLNRKQWFLLIYHLIASNVARVTHWGDKKNEGGEKKMGVRK